MEIRWESSLSNQEWWSTELWIWVFTLISKKTLNIKKETHPSSSKNNIYITDPSPNYLPNIHNQNKKVPTIKQNLKNQKNLISIKKPAYSVLPYKTLQISGYKIMVKHKLKKLIKKEWLKYLVFSI